MQAEYFTDWQRVIIGLIDNQIVGFATFVETDSIENTGYCPFIGYIYVDQKYRGKRISQLMINEAIGYAKTMEFKKVYIHSGEIGLYEKFGFKEIGKANSRLGELETIYEKSII